MSAVNAVEPTRNNQAFIDLQRENASLRREAEDAKRDAAQARRGETAARKEIEELKVELANETRAANSYWSALKRSRRQWEVVTSIGSNETVDIDDTLRS